MMCKIFRIKMTYTRWPLKTSLLLIFLLACGLLQAQEMPERRWGVELHYGLGVPVGGYSRVVPEQAIGSHEPFFEPYFAGFNKKGNSAAQPGQFISFVVAYRPGRSFRLNLKLTGSQNKVNTQPVSEYMTRFYNELLDINYLIYRVNQESYKAGLALIGVGYFKKYDKWTIALTPGIGVGILRFPDYNLALTNYEVDPPRSFTFYHRGNTPVSTSPALSVGGAVTYSISPWLSIGLNLEYNHANFDYTYELGAVGLDTNIITDTVSYRVLQVGLTAGFWF